MTLYIQGTVATSTLDVILTITITFFTYCTVNGFKLLSLLSVEKQHSVIESEICFISVFLTIKKWWPHYWSALNTTWKLKKSQFDGPWQTVWSFPSWEHLVDRRWTQREDWQWDVFVWLPYWLSSSGSARPRCVQLLYTYAATRRLPHTGLSSLVVSSTILLRWDILTRTNVLWIDALAQQAPHLPWIMNGFSFLELLKKKHTHTEHEFLRKILFSLRHVICMLDGHLFSLQGLWNNLGSSPVAVAGCRIACRGTSSWKLATSTVCSSFGTGLNTKP